MRAAAARVRFSRLAMSSTCINSAAETLVISGLLQPTGELSRMGLLALLVVWVMLYIPCYTFIGLMAGKRLHCVGSQQWRCVLRPGLRWRCAACFPGVSAA